MSQRYAIQTLTEVGTLTTLILSQWTAVPKKLPVHKEGLERWSYIARSTRLVIVHARHELVMGAQFGKYEMEVVPLQSPRGLRLRVRKVTGTRSQLLLGVEIMPYMGTIPNLAFEASNRWSKATPAAYIAIRNVLTSLKDELCR